MKNLLRSVPACLAGLLLAACGSAALSTTTTAVRPTGPPTPTSSTAATATPGDTASPPPSSVPATTPSPAAPSTMTPPPAVAAPPPAAPPLPPGDGTFAIRPLTAGGASGSVTVSITGGVARYHLVVAGLVPGSVHTIHDHLGSCSNAGATMHLTVLTTTAADRTGSIVADVSVPAGDAGPNRIVIVYANASPAVITGCADL